ncbi:ribonuclease H-like domain-containing protein [Tanacetum coccineum]
MVASFATQQLRQWQQPFMASLRALARLMMQPGVKGLRATRMTYEGPSVASRRREVMVSRELDQPLGDTKSEENSPVDTESKLGDGGTPVVDPTLYRSLAGSLQYLTFTRPDITYAVQQVCLYMHDPREPHFSALKRILRYVQGTLDYGLQLFSSTTDSLIAYSDADWAGCPTTRRSTSGYCVFLGNNLLSWSSKRQPTLSRSSVEANYRGVANDVAETCWIRNLLREVLHVLYLPPLCVIVIM